MKNRGTFQRLSRSAFEPMRITAQLQCGVIADAALPIDAILYYQAMREKYGYQEATFPGENHVNAVTGVHLPLARCEEHGPQWYYAASFAQWCGIAEGSDHWNCRFDQSLAHLIDFRGKRGKIDISSSAFKAYHMPVFYRHALIVTWYAMGSVPHVRGLLEHCSHIGKKTAQGWGSVLRWEIGPWPSDWSVRGPRGELMRAIPATGGLLMGYRPSYWLPKNQARCAAPAVASTNLLSTLAGGTTTSATAESGSSTKRET